MGKSNRNTGNWLVTYSDLVTLLLVFFVLLYTLTPGIDDATFDNFISYFQNSMNILDQNKIKTEQAESNEHVHIDEQIQQWELVEEFLERQGWSSEVDIKRLPDGVKITLGDSLTFESGSSELRPAAREVLIEISKIIDQEVRSLEVQGHTDNVPIIQKSYYRSNWHLGAARAITVVQFIQQRAGLPPERYKASSYGEFKPVASNNNSLGRRKNRRVEIYVRYGEKSQKVDFADST